MLFNIVQKSLKIIKLFPANHKIKIILSFFFLSIVVIRNSENVRFAQLIRGYKQSFTIIASWCTSDHNRVTNLFDIFTIN